MAELTITAANVIKGAGTTSRAGIAGATLTAGMPIYLDNTDEDLGKPCQANAEATASCDGICLNGASAGQPFDYLPSGDITLGTGVMTKGETYAVSDATAGKIRPVDELASGDYVTILGVAESTSVLALDIQNSGVTVT